MPERVVLLERRYMRKTLIALAVGGIASVAYAGNMNTGRFGAPVGVVTGETESGPIHSLIGQVSGVYPEPQMYNEGVVVTHPVVIGSASAIDSGSPTVGDSASVSRTWYMPDGSVWQEGPVSFSNQGMSSDDLLASSSWGGMSSSGSDVYILEPLQPDYVIIYGG
jgi:hypothetical protein